MAAFYLRHVAIDDASAALVRERDLDRYLATLYAPADARGGLFALHALDLELAQVAHSTTEPMLGQIRLAWWREQLQALDHGARPAQPVLAAVASELIPRGVSGSSLEPLEDANLALIDGNIAEHAVARSRLFEVALQILLPVENSAAVATARFIGEGWAIIDALRSRGGASDELLNTAEHHLRTVSLPTTARSLTGLVALARADLEALRAGRVPGTRGSPGRQARLLWSIVTGQ